MRKPAFLTLTKNSVEPDFRPDRKVHVSVRKSGTEVYSTTTDSIKVSDRIKASTGEEFYGKIITLPPLSDGPYQVISEILNTQGALVDSTTQDFTIDSVGPTADDLSILQKPGYEMVTREKGGNWALEPTKNYM